MNAILAAMIGIFTAIMGINGLRKGRIYWRPDMVTRNDHPIIFWVAIITYWVMTWQRS